MSGWISLHRKIMDNPIYSNAGMLKLWIHCLLKASHAEHKQLIGTQIIKLDPGQFVTGRDALAEEFNKGAKKNEVVTSRTLWRWLKKFEEWQMLSIKSTTQFSVVTILKWSDYQKDVQRVSNECPTNVQRVSTNNNDNNVNNENKNKVSRKSAQRIYEDDSDEMILVNYFIEQIRKNDPKFKEPNKQTWANTFRLLMNKDERDKREIAKLIKWVQQHDFWKSNILSPTSLRKKYSTLVIQMNSQSNVHQQISQQEQTTNYKQLTIDPNKGES